jgi:4-hydroxy-3-methylbut-2-en-1-yl diphosphate reductase
MGRAAHLCNHERSLNAVFLTPPSPDRGYGGRAVVKRLLLASPRGYCAGVERAVETVERALALYGSPVYVRKQIVHNSHVVEDLRSRGAVFVDALADVPDGATVVFSAHGIAPAVRREAKEMRLTTIDATCPLVTKVHAQARRYAEAGYALVLIGHAGHEEVEGTLGEAPDAIVLVQSAEDAESVSLPADRPLVYLTQTTLSVDEAGEIVAVLRRRFPHIQGPAREDICYATSNRQWAVKELLREIDLLLVIGSPNSSNSQRLVDVARAEGTSAHLVDDVGGIDETWLESCESVGLTSGASAPERLVADVCAWFAARGAEVHELEPVHEDVSFKLPVELRRAERAAA